VQYKCGDVDGDGKIYLDFGDSNRLSNYVVGASGVTLSSEWVGDVDGDGKIYLDFGDSNRLSNYVVGASGVTLNCKGC